MNDAINALDVFMTNLYGVKNAAGCFMVPEEESYKVLVHFTFFEDTRNEYAHRLHPLCYRDRMYFVDTVTGKEICLCFV